MGRGRIDLGPNRDLANRERLDRQEPGDGRFDRLAREVTGEGRETSFLAAVGGVRCEGL
jgi:hypothetical protein